MEFREKHELIDRLIEYVKAGRLGENDKDITFETPTRNAIDISRELFDISTGCGISGDYKKSEFIRNMSRKVLEECSTFDNIFEIFDYMESMKA